MPDYAWPDAQHRTLIGTRVTRVDSAVKVAGQAKYTYDVHRPGMLYGKVLRCPYAHAKIVSIDTTAAEKRSEEHTSELQSLRHLVCRLLLEKKKKQRHQ